MLFVRLIAQPEVKRPKRTYCSAAQPSIALFAVTSVAGLIECAGALVQRPEPSVPYDANTTVTNVTTRGFQFS